MSQSDFFLKIDGIDGESTDDKHKGELEISGWSWGATNLGTGSSGTTGSGAGKADLSDIVITKLVDKSTPKLLLACASGKHIKTAVLVCRKAGGDKQEYLTVSLEKVFISSYQSSASGGGPIPEESISLNYVKIKYEYKPQNADGSLAGVVAMTHDSAANTSA